MVSYLFSWEMVSHRKPSRPSLVGNSQRDGGGAVAKAGDYAAWINYEIMLRSLLRLDCSPVFVVDVELLSLSVPPFLFFALRCAVPLMEICTEVMKERNSLPGCHLPDPFPPILFHLLHHQLCDGSLFLVDVLV